MNKLSKHAVSVIVMSFGYSLFAYSQLNPKLQFGIGAGTFIYQGDLTPSGLGSYKTMKPQVNIFASRFLNSSFSVRANVFIGSLKGDDSKYNKPAYRQERNFKFRSSVAEISGIGEWNILGRNYVEKGFAPYIFGGIGYSFLKIRRDWSALNTEYFSAESSLMEGLAEDAQHSVPRGLIVFPVGVGTRYYFSDKFGISAETSYRLSATDYLDGFSRSANPAEKDHYYSHSVGVVYRLGKKNTFDCPVIRY